MTRGSPPQWRPANRWPTPNAKRDKHHSDIANRVVARAEPDEAYTCVAVPVFDQDQYARHVGRQSQEPNQQMAGIVSAKDVALLLEVFLTIYFSTSVTLFKDLKTSGTPLATRKRL